MPELDRLVRKELAFWYQQAKRSPVVYLASKFRARLVSLYPLALVLSSSDSGEPVNPIEGVVEALRKVLETVLSDEERRMKLSWSLKMRGVKEKKEIEEKVRYSISTLLSS